MKAKLRGLRNLYQSHSSTIASLSTTAKGLWVINSTDCQVYMCKLLCLVFAWIVAHTLHQDSVTDPVFLQLLASAEVIITIYCHTHHNESPWQHPVI